MRNKIEEGTLKPTPKIMFEKGESVKVIEDHLRALQE